MPGFDWNLLDSPAEWLQKLRELLSQGRAALSLADTTQLDAVEADLQAFITHCLVYGDLRAQARAGLAELLSRDIEAITARLNHLPLAGTRPAARPQAAPAPPSPLPPRQYLANAQAALVALRAQHHRRPFSQPYLDQQVADLLAIIQGLLESLDPPAPGKWPADESSTPGKDGYL